jgi:hypothetical protein
MKHLRKINEWKSSEDEKLDADNIREIEDIFLPLKDMDCEKFEIEVDGCLCRNCQLIDCDKCGTGVLYYEIIDNSVICENCSEGNND